MPAPRYTADGQSNVDEIGPAFVLMTAITKIHYLAIRYGTVMHFIPGIS
jgi:hypothetical protein